MSAVLPKIPEELIDQLVSGPMTGEAVNAATMAFKKALIERTELGHHLDQAGPRRRGRIAGEPSQRLCRLEGRRG
ncbi:hypothetical protein RM96_07970 [Cupriavidus sp. IDO]|nr:hypothetical protein RM96_07970 [Cupriavidus sp. IDO]